MLGIQEMTVFSFFSVIYVIKVSGLFLRTYKCFFVFFVQNPIASSCLLLAHDYNNNQFK